LLDMVRRLLPLAVSLALPPACSRPVPDVVVATNEAVDTTITPTQAPTTSASIAPRHGKPIFELDADLEGAGVEHVILADDGTLSIGARVFAAGFDDNPFFFAKQAALSVVDLDAARPLRGILFVSPTAEGEDPPNRIRLFLVNGADIEVAYDQVLGVYGPTELVFDGKGKATYREDSWTACERTKYPLSTTREDVTLALDKTRHLVEIARTPTKIAVPCREISG
jgi:hypothetical protein